ncbi:MAG: PorV/PorQ family protein [Elusimicrobia bacterium]|nr:PorV/PorQ family protein [Elusimicrobiota bacterium]
MKKPVFKSIGGRGTFCIVLLALYATPSLTPAVQAGFGSSSVGTSGAQFLKVASGARGAALGEAYSALADDAFALDWNPAGIVAIKKKSMVFMHAPYLAGTFVDYFGYAENAGEVGAWGVAVKYMNFGAIHKTDSSGFDLGVFTPYDISASVSFATYITGYNKEPEERFILGATGKFVRSKLYSSDNTISADIGLLFPYLFDNRFRLAMSAQNIMGTLRYDKEDTPLPLILRFGSVTTLTKYFAITADVVAQKDNLPYLAMGGEIKIGLSEKINAALRAGFNTRSISAVGGFHNITLGTGLRYGVYSIDYALSPFGDLGSVHRISASWNF